MSIDETTKQTARDVMRGRGVVDDGGDGVDGEQYRSVTGKSSKEVEKRINAVVVKHLSSVLGEQTVKVINYHLNRMGADIYNVCDEPKRVEDALYTLFKDGSRMLITEMVNALYTEFNVASHESKHASLQDVIKSVKESLCR
ncbi:MAG: hypothetical protein RMJ59_02350 [Candidatus Nitrosocaldus sp.]|nr:hypothetical protein [Candidatus Nitrosocaldus sp.]MDW8275208.1 hypothetical protein [Candidatus Nitrosocaldus sp.]